MWYIVVREAAMSRTTRWPSGSIAPGGSRQRIDEPSGDHTIGWSTATWFRANRVAFPVAISTRYPSEPTCVPCESAQTADRVPSGEIDRADGVIGPRIG